MHEWRAQCRASSMHNGSQNRPSGNNYCNRMDATLCTRIRITLRTRRNTIVYVCVCWCALAMRRANQRDRPQGARAQAHAPRVIKPKQKQKGNVQPVLCFMYVQSHTHEQTRTHGRNLVLLHNTLQGQTDTRAHAHTDSGARGNRDGA